MYTAKIKVPYSEELYQSFIAEEKKTERFEYELLKEKKELVFDVKANDSVALRAALNSITKLISVFEKAENAVNE
jgi:tRNA threonylcarbamoyladenosine modification (KEOPS) complex  Pcc1 subunit